MGSTLTSMLQAHSAHVLDPLHAHDARLQVFGITRDPFIIWTSNMFAIASLRALYGFVIRIMQELRFLDKAVAVVLAWIGVKMLIDVAGVHVPTEASLAVVISVLAGGVGASLWLPQSEPADE